MLSKRISASFKPIQKLVLNSSYNFSSHWPRPDPTPPKHVAASRLVPPFLRQLYLQHDYYPEYRTRTDDATLEDFEPHVWQFIMFHLGIFAAFGIYYFCFHRWIPMPVKVFLLRNKILKRMVLCQMSQSLRTKDAIALPIC